MNLFHDLQRNVPADPAAPFLAVDDGRSFSYGDLDRLSARAAHALVGAGVGVGDRVVVQVDKSPEAVFLYLGCLRAGAVYVPLNTAYTTAEVSYFVNDAEPAAVVCRPESREAIGSLTAATVLTLGADGAGSLADAMAAGDDGFADAARADDDLTAILYTSGTTGVSKGAMLTRSNLASNARALADVWRFRADDVLLHALPLFHTHGLFVAVHCTLMSGSRMIFQARFSASAALARLPEATVMMGVPTFYVRLLDEPGLNAEACRNMRLFTAGSAPLLPATFEAFAERTGHRVLERYGMTETGMITSNPYDGERIAGTVGYPLPDVEVRIADDQGKALPAGEKGMLEVRGPNVFAGYWRKPEKTAEEFRADGFFITGDVAIMAPDGRVAIVGREKDLVISGGFNVYPQEIEALIDDVAGVKESAVIGLPHPDFGEGVTAVVVPDGNGEVDEASVLAALGGRLARFKQPKKVIVVDSLPRNAMGKVQKSALRTQYAGLYSSASDPA